jgi:hypothetical protein
MMSVTAEDDSLSTQNSSLRTVFCGTEEGLEQSPMRLMAFIQKLRVPLHAEEECVGRRFNGFDHAIRGDCADGQARGHLLDRLMMGAVDPNDLFSGNALKEAVGRHANRMTQAGSRHRRPMPERRGDLRRNVLDECASKGHVDGLHAAADTQHRQRLIGGYASDVQFERIPLLTDDTEIIPLSLAVKTRRKIGTASGQQQTMHTFQHGSPHGMVGRQRQNDRHAAEFFNGPNVSGPQKIRRLFSAPLFAIAGIEVRRNPDDRLHAIGYFAGSGSRGAGSCEAPSGPLSAGMPKNRTLFSPFKCSGVMT